MMRLMITAVTAACTLGLLMGCSKDDAPSAAAAADTAKDHVAAAAAVLQLGDLPSGYQAAPNDPKSADEADELNTAAANCMGIDPALLRRNDNAAASPKFTGSGESVVASEASFEATTAEAEANVNLLRKDAFARCLVTAMRQQFQHAQLTGGAEVGEIQLEPLPFAALGDEVVAYRTLIPVGIGGTQVQIIADSVLVRVGRGAVSMSFQSNATPFPAADAERLTRIVVDRMPATA